MDYFYPLLTQLCIYGILAVSLNLVVGYTGLLSITHAAFYGIGAYATAILTTRFGFDFFVALLVAVFITAVISFLIGIVLGRFRDDYYVLASFGFNMIVYSIFVNWSSVTNGPLGIPAIQRPVLFGFSFNDPIPFLLLSVFFLVLTVLVAYLVVRSSFGRVLKAIREDEKALQVFGYDTKWFKMAVFVISACLAVSGGALFAALIRYIDPSTFTSNESIFLLSMVILGGLASLRGSILGACILTFLPELLRFVGFPNEVAAQVRQAVYGFLLIFFMLYKPQGLAGEYKL